MKCLCFLFTTLLLYSCWKPYNTNIDNPLPQQKVWGSKPIYSAESTAKQILYNPQKQPLQQAGNIYAFGRYIFQVDVGRGIHVIDNADPSKADRIGFITVNGCEQISIKGAFLYTNSFGDLVTLDIANPPSPMLVKKIVN